MVDARESYQSGNRLIVVRNDDPADGPTVYTLEEARELYEQLGELIDT